MAEDNRSKDDRDRQDERAMHGQSGQGYPPQYGQGPASYGAAGRSDEHGQSGLYLIEHVGPGPDGPASIGLRGAWPPPSAGR